MATHCPLNRKPHRFRRLLLILLLLFVGFSLPFGAYWMMERTERRIRTAERMLMEELALLRAQVAALSEEQAASREAVEQLRVTTERLLDRWESQGDKLAAGAHVAPWEASAGGGTTAQPLQEGAGPGTLVGETAEAGEEGERTLWALWWAGVAYYGMKAGQYVTALYNLLRLHPAIP